MNKSYFEDIEMHIIEEIMGAKKEIDLAVAWLTNVQLIKCLRYKRENGVAIKIIINDDKINKNVDLDSLKDAGCEIIMAHKRGIMHVKFCIIDDKIVISGSFNWTKNAEENNQEQITITKDDVDEVGSFKKRFNELTEKFSSRNKEDDANKEEEIIVPTLYSRIPGNLNNLQQKTLLAILIPLQPYIKAQIEEGQNKDKESIFDRVAISDTISVEGKYIGIGHTHCSEWFNTSIELKDLRYPSILIKEEPIFLENSGTVFKDITRKKNTSTIEFTFNKGVLSTLCNLKYGFFKVKMSEVLAFKKKCSLHLYILLSRYNGFRNRVTFKFNDLQKYLGITELYHKFSQANKQMLNPSTEEFYELFEKGKISYYFEFEPIRLGTRRKGNPDKIEFRLLHK